MMQISGGPEPVGLIFQKDCKGICIFQNGKKIFYLILIPVCENKHWRLFYSRKIMLPVMKVSLMKYLRSAPELGRYEANQLRPGTPVRCSYGRFL